MFADLVKKVTVVCGACGTSIKFNVSSEKDEIRELMNATSKLECPKCTHSLAYEADDMIRNINAYNEVASKLNNLEKEYGFKLD